MRGIFHYLPFLTLVVKTRDSVSCSWLRFFPVGPNCHFPSVSDGNKYNVQIIMRVDSLFFDTGFYLTRPHKLEVAFTKHMKVDSTVQIQILTQDSGLQE